jgi:hypothetical protein
MKSKWFEYKTEACELRRQGVSMTVIEQRYGIPRSTLSGWFRDIKLTEPQRTRLMKNQQDGWKKARENAVKWHNKQKQDRLLQADQQAAKTIEHATITPELLDITLAMLYFGEGAKNGTTSMSNSNPLALRFMLSVLYVNYGITPSQIRCDLHLRADQNSQTVQQYWQEELKLPASCFRYTAYDKRTVGKATYDDYMGVCVVTCQKIAIQRKLISLYNQFCSQVSESIMGA